MDCYIYISIKIDIGTSKDFNSIIDYAAFTCAIIIIGVCLFYIMKNASIEGYRYLVVDSNRGRPLSRYTMSICYGLGVLIIIYSGDYKNRIAKQSRARAIKAPTTDPMLMFIPTSMFVTIVSRSHKPRT